MARGARELARGFRLLVFLDPSQRVQIVLGHPDMPVWVTGGSFPHYKAFDRSRASGEGCGRQALNFFDLICAVFCLFKLVCVETRITDAESSNALVRQVVY